VANSELAICSWASAAGGLASATVLGPSAASRMTSGSGPLNSPPVSPEIEFIHLATPQNVRFGRAASNIGNERPAVRQGSFDGQPTGAVSTWLATTRCCEGLAGMDVPDHAADDIAAPVYADRCSGCHSVRAYAGFCLGAAAISISPAAISAS